MGYRAQVSAYLKATGLKDAVVLVKNKDTSDLREQVLTCDEKLLDERLRKLDEVLDSDTPDKVQREYGPDEDGALPWQCSYCSFVKTCWKDYQPIQEAEHKWILAGSYKEA